MTALGRRMRVGRGVREGAKPAIVTRDIGPLSQLPDADVGLTVASTDDAVSRWLEVRAPSASGRLRTLTELRAAGVPTFAFVGPLLPRFSRSAFANA